MPPTSVGSMPVRPVLRSTPIGPRVRSRAALSFSIPRFAESADVQGLFIRCCFMPCLHLKQQTTVLGIL